MRQRKYNRKDIQVTQIGGSLGFIIPKKFADEIGLRKGDVFIIQKYLLTSFMMIKDLGERK